MGGNPDGDITVVEFIDYRCGYCRKAWQEVDQLVEQDGNIRFVLKEFPILGEQSVLSSRALPYRSCNCTGARPTRRRMTRFCRCAPMRRPRRWCGGEDLGLEPQPIMDHLNTPEVTKIIEDNHKLAQILQVSGTPTFVIDGTFVRGYVPLDGMQQIVDGQRRTADHSAASCAFSAARSRRLLFHEFDDVVDHLVVAQLVGLLARQIDHAGPCPATGEADIGHQRLAGTVHTQPMIDSDMEVVMWASRSSSAATVLITSKP